MMKRTENVQVNLQFNVTRELEENEVLCPVCSGTSLHIEGIPLAQTTNGVYELKKFGKYSTIIGCNSCYFGVQKKCRHCSELMGRMSWCDCNGSRNERNLENTKKKNVYWDSVKKITYEEALEKYE